MNMERHKKGFLLKIPQQLHKDLGKYCDKKELTMTHVIRQQIEELVNRAKMLGIIK